MPEYLAPGVYIEEVNSGPRPIEGVSTSTAGFVGETERGPDRPRMVTSWLDYQRWFGGYIDEKPFDTPNIYLPYAVRGFFENGGMRLFVARVSGAGAASAVAEVPTEGPKPMRLRAIGKGEWGNYLMVAVEPSTAARVARANEKTQGANGSRKSSPVTKWFRLKVLYYRKGIPKPFLDPTDPNNLAQQPQQPDVMEDFDDLSPESSETNFVMTVVNGSSRLIEVTEFESAPREAKFEAAPFKNGKSIVAREDQFLDSKQTDPEARTGLAGLLAIREISLMAIPDEVVMPQLSIELVQTCEQMKDRFAILSDPATNGNSNYTQLRPVRDSAYGAFYHPWVRVLAPHTALGSVLVPPAGHVAGVFARTDVERGVHKAPANEVLRGIVLRDLGGGRKPLSRTLNKQEQDVLNPKGVNLIRDFRADRRDIRVYGARTMSTDAMWKYINVRRLFIFIEQSIDRGTQWAVFEPNSEVTWTAVRASITGFLNTVWRNGALMGTTQDEAFFVKCDRTTMTQDDFDNGRLICLIGIAPVKPAEFVIFRFSQKTLEADS